LRLTDAAYWQILDFDLLDGRLLAADDIDQGRFVAVINEATADSLFPGRSAIGEVIDAGADSFEVVGVVADEPITSLLAYADIWVPHTTTVAGAEEWVGQGIAMLWLEDVSRIPAAQAEYAESLAAFVYTPDPAQFERADSSAMTMLEVLATGVVGDMQREYGEPGATPGTRVAAFIGIASIVVLLFMALPAINMANLNIGRILERAPEIGLRKATGASRAVLVGQFIFENLVLCAIGGLVAFALAPVVLGILNETVFPYGQLGLNVKVFVAGFGFVLLFGVLSGAYPALKMARLDPAAALRGMRHA
jgi:putative ABC transport system permease protein